MIDDTATTEDGRTISGFLGLRRFLEDHQEEVLRSFCSKLLGYALGRSVLPSDQELMDGNKHDATQMPMLLAGRGGGVIKTGRTLDYSNKDDNHRRACSLYLSLMDHMGVSLDHFGDADSRLTDI